METGLMSSTLRGSSHKSRYSQIPDSNIVDSSGFPCTQHVRFRRGWRLPHQITINAVASVNGTKINGTTLDTPNLSGNKLDAANGSMISHGKSVSVAPTTIRNEDGLERGKVVSLIAAAILAVARQKNDMIDQDIGTEIFKNQNLWVDSSKSGRLLENDSIYRQAFVIRSYEVGFDKLASIETFTNLFQETALNHVGMSDFVGGGMGTTHAMMRHRLIWVVTKMHIQVDHYPAWGDVVEIDSWVCGSGKNGMRRDFLVRDYASREVLSRATSTWAMMNKDTRRLAKMPDDVKAEISPYFYDKHVMEDEPSQKIKKLDDSAIYIRENLVPKLRDMDMNQHVNNVKYIGWVLESVPQSLLVAHELETMTLEYRQECSASDVVSSMTHPSSLLANALSKEHAQGKRKLVRQGSHTASCPNIFELHPPDIASPVVTPTGDLMYTHLLSMQADGSEILRGRTKWRLKQRFLDNSNRIQV